VASVTGSSIRPAELCKALLAALDASDGRRRSRKRDQTPDAIGLQIKRELLERAVKEDPPPDAFEGWLLNCSLTCKVPSGAVAAMSRIIFDEWSLAHSMGDFKTWLEHGAPSDDASAKPTATINVTEHSSFIDAPSALSSSPPRGRGKGEGELR
jgi:hypothetical protein